LGARRAESATRAQTLSGREARNGLTKHPDLPRVWVSNPIQHLTTEEVWAYLLQHPPAWRFGLESSQDGFLSLCAPVDIPGRGCDPAFRRESAIEASWR
jgi:hypothetical protein